MHFVISCIFNNKYYYVEKVDDKYVGFLIKNYVAGMNSFRDFDTSTRIEVNEEEFEDKIVLKGQSRFKWIIMGKVVDMKDSSIKLVI